MSVALFRPTPPLRRSLRRWAAACALAAALSTLAGGDPTAWPVGHGPAPAAAASVNAAPLAAPVGTPGRSRPTSGSVQTASAPMRAASLRSNDAHPFAPGGDDLLPWDTGATAPPRAATPVLPPSNRGAARATSTRTQAPAGTPIVPAPPPSSSLLVWLERTRVRLGEQVVLHVVRNGVEGCRGADALQGLGQVGDRVVLRATAAGRQRLAVQCQGRTGPLEQAATLVVPLPAYASSVESRQRSDLDPARVPSPWQLGLPGAAPEGVHDVRTAGDFLQEGRLSLVVATAGVDGSALVHLLARDELGRWRDRSADWLAGADRRGCLRPVQALTADFNHDGLPDAYLACSDAEPQLLFISQPDGRYRRVEVALGLPSLQAEAADVDHDGAVDVVTVALVAGSPRTLVLLGRGDGSFVVDDEAGAAALQLLSGAGVPGAAVGQGAAQGRR